MKDLAAMYQVIIMIKDNSDDDDLLNLRELLVKNECHHRQQARKIRHLHDSMAQERLDFSTKLVIGNSISKITTTTAKDRSDQKAYTEHRYEAECSQGNLTNDLKVKSLARSG